MVVALCEAEWTAMSTIKAEKFGEICDGVWRDRAAILFHRGALSGEDALIRAVYWRLCKAGGDSDRKVNDYAGLLNQLVQQYRDEEGQKS